MLVSSNCIVKKLYTAVITIGGINPSCAKANTEIRIPTPMIPIVSSFSLLFLTDFHTRSDDCIYWATEAELHPGAFVHSIPACLQYSVSIWSKPMVAVAMNFTRLPSNKSRLQCVRVRTISASASRTSSGVKSFPGA